MKLLQYIKNYSDRVGPSEAARNLIDPKKGTAIDRTTLFKWIKGQVPPPLWAVQAVIDMEEREVAEFSGVLPWEGEKLRICIPCNGGVNAKLAKALNYLQYRHKGKVSIDIVENTLVDIARDQLAHRFMKSEAEWLLFIDSDMVPPIGDYAQMKAWGMEVPTNFGNFDIIQRLVTRQKTLVSGLYYDRTGKRIARYHEALNDSKEQKWAQGAPYDVLKKTKGCGCGCMLINRVVFERMMEDLDDIKPVQNGVWRFFERMPGMGEDFSFCLRAEAVGHPAYIDCGCLVGHEGNHVFW